jgi:hypothetical protein
VTDDQGNKVHDPEAAQTIAAAIEAALDPSARHRAVAAEGAVAS